MVLGNNDLFGIFKMPARDWVIDNIYANARPLEIIIVTVKDSLKILCFGQIL